jgi:L-ribulose-5-phosphate 3-epimerase UlaE
MYQTIIYILSGVVCPIREVCLFYTCHTVILYSYMHGVLQLSLETQFLGFHDGVHMPLTSRTKATESDIRNYRCELARQLRCIKLPAYGVLCYYYQCHNQVQLQTIDKYAKDITNANLAAAAAAVAIPQT